MAKNIKKTFGPTDVQVFELTMDNDEDQDELNRRLRKPEEVQTSAPLKVVAPENSFPADTSGPPSVGRV